LVSLSPSLMLPLLPLSLQLSPSLEPRRPGAQSAAGPRQLREGAPRSPLRQGRPREHGRHQSPGPPVPRARPRA
ncbi:hypothetical protein KI387_030420, partial [Taxus chinensis]